MKQQTSKSKTVTPRRRAKANGRVNTHKANGSLPESKAATPEPEETVTIGEAMRRAVEELGEILVDDQLAPQQMRQLAESYEEVARRQAAFKARSEEAKTAKKSLDSATELLLEQLRTFTHPAPLPLFDAAAREVDREEMLDAAERGGAEA